jgi:hypothetical protein
MEARRADRARVATAQAVATGIKASAGVVTSAAIVMVAVFSIFATLGEIAFRQLGDANWRLPRASSVFTGAGRRIRRAAATRSGPAAH